MTSDTAPRFRMLASWKFIALRGEELSTSTVIPLSRIAYTTDSVTVASTLFSALFCKGSIRRDGKPTYSARHGFGFRYTKLSQPVIG
jgi:hypothetical protein